MMPPAINRPPLAIDQVNYTTASAWDRQRGLLGYVSLRLNGRLRIDGMTLRRTATGRLTLSYPERRDQLGVPHPILRPIDTRTRREIEAQVFKALGLEEAR